MSVAGYTFYFDWEVRLIESLQARLGMTGAAIASFFSAFGEELIAISILAFLYWCWDKRFGKYVGLNLLVGIVSGSMLKNVFLRRRPYFDNTSIYCLKKVDKSGGIFDITAQGYSFPSIHSVNSVTLFGSTARYGKKAWLMIPAILIPLLCGISRFFLGVHYPTDVLVGWLLGTLIVFLIPFLEEKIKNRWIFYSLLLLLTLPGFFFCRSDDYFTSFGILVGFIAAVEFEERFVRFEKTRNVFSMLLRILPGLGLFVLMITLFKLPFTEEFLRSRSFSAHLVRALRYGIATFLAMGVYPYIFRYTDRLFRRKTSSGREENADTK